LPKQVEHWSLTTIREKLVKIGAKVVAHGRYVTFQMAEIAVPRDLSRELLTLIDGLRRPSLAAGCLGAIWGMSVCLDRSGSRGPQGASELHVRRFGVILN
jgi:hypothetical protein